jgi:hypothetical protein
VQRHFALWKTFRGIAITVPVIAITPPTILNQLIGINPEQVSGIPSESLIGIAKNGDRHELGTLIGIVRNPHVIAPPADGEFGLLPSLNRNRV